MSIIYKTGRQRRYTRVVVANLVGTGEIAPDAFGMRQYVQDADALAAAGVFPPLDSGGNVTAVGTAAGRCYTFVSLASFIGCSMSVTNGLSVDTGGLSSPATGNLSVEATFTFEIDLEEYLEVYTPSNSVEIDGDYFREETDQTAYPDGLPNEGHRYFELPRIGGHVIASIEVPGVDTVSVDDEITSGNIGSIDFGDYAVYMLGAMAATASKTSPSHSRLERTKSISMASSREWSFPTLDESLDWPGGALACSVDMSDQINITIASNEVGMNALSTNSISALAEGIFRERTYYDFQGRYRNIGGASSSGRSTTIITGEGGAEIAGNSPDHSWSQRSYNGKASLNGSVFLEGGNEVTEIRSWLSSQPADDGRDWRLQFQTWPWHALTVAQDETLEVATGETITDADETVPTTETNWEGYRYLRFTANCPFTPRTVGLTLGSKRYEFTSGTAGIPTEITIDLAFPANLPSGFAKDHRDSRFPLEGPATPITADPDIDTGDDKDDGWLFGILEPVSSIVFDPLGAGEYIVLSNIQLRRVTNSEATILQPFDATDILKGWESETDNTYLTPLLWLYSDHKLIGPWPFRAHVAPISGSGDYHVYWTLATLESHIEYIPGWTATVEADHSYPHVAGDEEAKLRGAASPSGLIDSYIWNGADWVLQIGLTPTCDLWATLRADEISAYPGCGNPAEGYDDALNYVFPLRCSKVVRGQAEGFAPEGETVILKRDSNGANRGSGVIGTDLAYRTGTPWGIGNVQHRTELQQGSNPSEGPFRTQNRMRSRTSFLAALAEAFGAALAVRADGSIYLADVDGDTEMMRIAEADPQAPTTFNPRRDTSVLARRVSMAAGTEGLWVLRIAPDGTTDLRLTDSLGQEWIDVISLPSADDAAICRVNDGRLLVLTLESGTVKGRLYDPMGTLVEGPWDTNVTGLSEDNRLDAAAYPMGGSSFGIDLAISGDGAPTVVSSTDSGLTFS